MNNIYRTNLHFRLIVYIIKCSSFALSDQHCSPLQVSYVVPVPVAVGCLWIFFTAVKIVKLALSYSSSGVSWLLHSSHCYIHAPHLTSCGIENTGDLSLFMNVHSYRCGCDWYVCVCPDFGHWAPSGVESFRVLCRSMCACVWMPSCLRLHACAFVQLSKCFKFLAYDKGLRG